MQSEVFSNITYTLEKVPVQAIESHPENDFSMREDELEELMGSIESDGLGQLPLVRRLPDGTLQMIAGHRRLEAYRRLACSGAPDAARRFATIPVNVIDGLDDARATVLLNVTNLITRNLTQEERGARYAAIGREVPAMRKLDPTLKGVRTNEVIARIVTQETGKPVSEATVKRAIAAERRLQEAKQHAAKLAANLSPDWQVEADTGRFDPLVLKMISELPERKQDELFIEYQREEMSPGTLRLRIKQLQPKTKQDAQRELNAAIRSVRAVIDMQRDNVPIPQGLVHKLHSLIDRL